MSVDSVPDSLVRVLGEVTTLAAGKIIFRREQRVRTLYLLDSGVVSTTVSQDGVERLVAIKTRGCLLGILPALATERCAVRATTLTPAVVRPVTVSGLTVLRAEQPEVDQWLIACVAREAHDLTEWVGAMASHDSRPALEHILVTLFRAEGVERSDGSIRLRLDISVTQLAHLLGVSRQWTSQRLSALEETRTPCGIKAGWSCSPRAL